MKFKDAISEDLYNSIKTMASFSDLTADAWVHLKAIHYAKYTSIPTTQQLNNPPPNNSIWKDEDDLLLPVTVISTLVWPRELDTYS